MRSSGGRGQAFGAELEVIGVVTTEYLETPALMDASGLDAMRRHAEEYVQHGLDAVIAELPEGVTAHVRRATGDPVELLAARTAELDLLVIGSRGYGPLRSVLVGGVSGRLLRKAECPVIVVPRGIEAPLESLFGANAATAA